MQITRISEMCSYISFRAKKKPKQAYLNIITATFVADEVRSHNLTALALYYPVFIVFDLTFTYYKCM